MGHRPRSAGDGQAHADVDHVSPPLLQRAAAHRVRGAGMTPTEPLPDAGTEPQAGRRTGLPRWLKVIIWLVVFAVVVFVLFTSVFPWLDRNVLNDPTLGASAAATST